jgi:hypothetical protein
MRRKRSVPSFADALIGSEDFIEGLLRLTANQMKKRGVSPDDDRYVPFEIAHQGLNEVRHEIEDTLTRIFAVRNDKATLINIESLFDRAVRYAYLLGSASPDPLVTMACTKEATRASLEARKERPPPLWHKEVDELLATIKYQDLSDKAMAELIKEKKKGLPAVRTIRDYLGRQRT